MTTKKMRMHPLTEALYRAKRWSTQRRGGNAPTGFQETEPALQQAMSMTAEAESQAESKVEQHGQAWQSDVTQMRSKRPEFVPSNFRGSDRTIKLETDARMALGKLDHSQRKYDAIVAVSTAQKVAMEYDNRYKMSWDRDVAQMKRRNPKFTAFQYKGTAATQALGQERAEATQKWERAEKTFRDVEAETPKPNQGGFNFESTGSGDVGRPSPSSSGGGSPAPASASRKLGFKEANQRRVTSQVAATTATADLTAMATQARVAKSSTTNQVAQFALEDAAERFTMAAQAAKGTGQYGRGGGMNTPQGKADTVAHVEKAQQRIAEAQAHAENQQVRESMGKLNERLITLSEQIRTPGQKPQVVGPNVGTPTPRRRKTGGGARTGTGKGGSAQAITVRGNASVGA